MNVNVVILAGNLTRDPELRYSQSGTAVCKFGVAVNRRYTVNGEQREDTAFVDCTAFGKTAEAIANYLARGRGIYVQGRLNFSQWESEGQKRSKLDVIVDSFQFTDKKPDANGSGPRGVVSGGRDYAPQHDDVDSIPF